MPGENLGGTEQTVRLNLAGPSGLGREAFRTDMRKIVAGYWDSEENKVLSARLDRKKLTKGKPLENPGGEFRWIAATNKYFAAIVVPLADDGKSWLTGETGRFYNPDGDARADSGDETLGLDLSTASTTLAASGEEGSSRTYNFQMYLGVPAADREFVESKPAVRIPPGIYARNLKITRLVHSPVVLGEPLQQNNRKEAEELVKINSGTVPERIKLTAYAYYEAIRQYFTKK